MGTESWGWDGVCSFFCISWLPDQIPPQSVCWSFHATCPTVTSKPACGCFKEWFHDVTHFSSLEGKPPFTWAALCLAPRWSGGSWGKSFSAFVSQHPVYCLGFWSVLPDALALPPQRQMKEEEETCARDKCLFLAIRGIPDLHLCFPVPVPCWHQDGNLLWQLVARSPCLAFK